MQKPNSGSFDQVYQMSSMLRSGS